MRPLRNALVFADARGDLLDLDRVSKSFAAIARSIGIKCKGKSLHSLRHFVGTTAHVGGTDARNVGALLGHADGGLVERLYAHPVPSVQVKAVGTVGDDVRAAQARRALGQK